MMTVEQVDERIAELKRQLNEPATECEIYTRIVGYYRSLKNWNPGKREEYRRRESYNVPQLPESVADSITRPEWPERRTTFRPDQKGALPIVGEFKPLQLGKVNNGDWDLSDRQEEANDFATCEACQ